MDINDSMPEGIPEFPDFEEHDIPWDNIAFTVIRETLKLYFKDRPKGVYPLHMGDIPSPYSNVSP